MKRDDWMLLTLTFLTGLAIGMYVYIMFFKLTYVPENLNTTESEANEWSLVSERRVPNDHGGYTQPSFRLLGDRSYTYLPGGNLNQPVAPREGKISAGLMRELRSWDTRLQSYTPMVDVAYCAGDQDGYDYMYRAVVAGVAYYLDTCETALGYDTELAVLLATVWAEIEGVRQQGGTYDSFADWAEDWIRRNLGVEQ